VAAAGQGDDVEREAGGLDEALGALESWRLSHGSLLSSPDAASVALTDG